MKWVVPKAGPVATAETEAEQAVPTEAEGSAGKREEKEGMEGMLVDSMVVWAEQVAVA